MHLIDGQALAERMEREIQTEVLQLPFVPRLAVLLVGEDPASHLYVRLKKKIGEQLGLDVDVHHLPAETSLSALKNLVESWNKDETIDGILIQVPLPQGHDEDALIAFIDPTKDVDGFHPDNVHALQAGTASIIPPVHEGILRLIGQSPLRINGAHSVVIANSTIFAKPLTRLLTTAGSFVTSMHPDELNLPLLKTADLIVVAVGRYKFLTPDMTKEDVVLVDVGTNHLPNGKVRGDVDQEAYHGTDAWITPVPGGVGPMTIAQLLKNVVETAKRRRGLTN